MKKTAVAIALILSAGICFAEESISQQANFFYAENNIEKAFNLFLSIPDEERSAQDWLLLGNILQDKGKTDDAVFMYKHAINTDSKFFKAYYNLGNVYLEQNQPNLAVENYKKAIKLNDENPYVHYNLGCAYLKLDKPKTAKWEFLKAISLKNTVADFHLNMAYTYKLLGKEKEAETYIKYYNEILEKQLQQGNFMKYRGIIFDFNGTLFWDSKKHYDAWYKFSEKLRGTPFSENEMREKMFGRTNEAIIEYAIGRKPDKETVKKLTEEKEGLYRQMCREDKENTCLAQGAEDLLDFLCKNNIPHTIATMSEKNNVDFFIEEFRLPKWFDINKIVYDNGKIPGKPAPDIYLIAAEKLGLSPAECIVVEDAVSGIEAARAAGIGKIIAIDSMEPVEVYKKIPAVSQIITSFDEIDRNLFYCNTKKALN